MAPINSAFTPGGADGRTLQNRRIDLGAAQPVEALASRLLLGAFARRRPLGQQRNVRGAAQLADGPQGRHADGFVLRLARLDHRRQGRRIAAIAQGREQLHLAGRRQLGQLLHQGLGDLRAGDLPHDGDRPALHLGDRCS